MRTHNWDAALAARYRPLLDALGDRFILAADESRGALDVGGLNKVSVTRQAVEALGLYAPEDFAWRCGDYALYLARRAFPGFRQYWLMETDVVLAMRAPDRLLTNLSGRRDDFLAFFTTPAGPEWSWSHIMAPFVRPVYRCAYPFVRLSGRALDRLLGHRIAMSQKFLASGQPAGHWPNDESFTATMIAAMHLPMGDLGEIRRDILSRYFSTFRPLHADAPIVAGYSAKILHPVLSGAAFVRKARSYIREFDAALADQDYLEDLKTAACRELGSAAGADIETSIRARSYVDMGALAERRGLLRAAYVCFRQADRLDPGIALYQVRLDQARQALHSEAAPG